MYVHNNCFVNIVCNFECLLMILIDSDRKFKPFQGSVNISIYKFLELELLRVGNREVVNQTKQLLCTYIKTTSNFVT